MIRRRQSTKLLELKAQAKAQGWLKYLRHGPGEEADERALLNGCFFSIRRAEHWLEFADRFGTLTEGPWKGKKFELLDWQIEDTSRVFGWLKHNPEWGYPVRRFRFAYLEVPKKNGKTPLVSLMETTCFSAIVSIDRSTFICSNNAKTGRAMLAACNQADSQSRRAIRCMRDQEAGRLQLYRGW